MSGVVRLLLIWFIAAAVPLKGLAAVTMDGCGPGLTSPRPVWRAIVQHTTTSTPLMRAKDPVRRLRPAQAEAVNEVLQTASDPSTGHSAQREDEVQQLRSVLRRRSARARRG
jgi:hypothetical protein